MLQKIDLLAEVCDPGTQVIVLGNVNDVQIYRSLVRQGVTDYLVPPVDAKQVLDTITGICADPNDMPPGRVIAFIGAKGGTGSSTVAHNTAWSLSKMFDDDVSVLDLDLAFGTVGLAFNLEAQQGIEDALSHPERLDEVLLERFTAKQDEHLFLLTSHGSLETDAEIDPEAFDVLLNLVRRTAPFVILDLPHLWSRWTRHALGMADEIVLMHDGEIEQIGTPDEVYDRPANRFVADFIGTPSMNFLSGKVVAENGSPAFRAENVQVSLPDSVPATSGREITCGLRPADLSLSETGSINGKLILAEKTGADIHLHVAVGDRNIVAVVPRSANVAAGQTVRLAIDPAKVHLFDAVTQHRVN